MENGTGMNFTTTNISIGPTANAGGIVLVALINWFTIFSMFATFTLNGLIVLVYAVRKDLRTPFNAYIANIAIAEALLTVIVMPCNFARSYYGYWPYNAIFCSFHVYTSTVLGTAARYGHALITANRIWAVAFPLTYRTAHTNRFSHTVICATWLFLNVLFLPSVIKGRQEKATLSTDPTCHNDISQQVTSAVVAEVIGFDLPQIFIVLTFPYIMWKLHQKRFKTAIKGRPSLTVAPSGLHSAGRSETRAHTGLRVSLPALENPKSQRQDLPEGQEEDAKAAPVNTQRIRTRQTARSHNKVLIFFVIGTIICWTPNHVYFLIVDTSKNYWDANVNTVQFFLQYSYSWINPILCYIAMRQLRKAINDLVFCRGFRGLL